MANREKIKKILFGLVGLVVVFFCIWEYAVLHVTDIFNAIASKQPIFKGKIHAERLDASFDGHIIFKNLVWSTDKDEPIVKIPYGKLRINPMDVISMHITTDSIKRLELHNTSIKLLFDENWNLDVIQQDWKPTPKEDDGIKPAPQEGKNSQPAPKKKRIKNLNLSDKLPNWKVVIKDCSVEAYHMNRQYLMKDVGCDLAISNHSLVKINFSSGPLTGTMQGAGIDVTGTTDFKVNKTNTHVEIKEVVPASLGIGKLSNAVSISSDFTGPADDPQVDGIIRFKTLEIKPFVFTDVKGKFKLVGDIVDITDTTGYCYGGTINAHGKYNIDSQRYKLTAVANELELSQLARGKDIVGKADLNFQLFADPKHKNTATVGNFRIGKGHAKHGHFHGIEGQVFAHNKNIFFKNVLVKLGIGHLRSHHFSIENGKFNDKPVLENEAAVIAELDRI